MRTSTVIIGAGHAGLAMSRRLTERSIDHVVLERGEVANSWRTERWPSLRLLTPNWQTRLPGFAYEGDDPDGFMTTAEVAGLIGDYARDIGAPVRAGTSVLSVRADRDGYDVMTDQGCWSAPTVVLASGACNVAAVPPGAEGVPASIATLTPMTYRGADRLADGGVLVVGAGATGVQLADEVHRSGRPVTLAVGEHVRLPRTYRGWDIFRWMERAGVLDERYDEVDDIARVRHLPSPQLIGTPHRAPIDLNALTAIGVRLRGRFAGIVDGRARFAGSLANVCALADLKMNRLLDTLDEWARQRGLDENMAPVERFDRTRVEPDPALELDLAGEISTIIWSTGYRPDYSWLDVPVLDRRQRVRHEGGVVTDAPGMYLLGTPMLRRRRSSYIHGSVSDTAELSSHLHRHLDGHDPRGFGRGLTKGRVGRSMSGVTSTDPLMPSGGE